MTLALITAPTAEPVTLEELRVYALIDHIDDDAIIAGLGRAAREFVEAFTGLALASATWELTARAWPAGIMVLPKPPLQNVVTVKHRDVTGNVVTLAANTDYVVDLPGGAIEPVRAWPAVGDYPDAVQVRFTAGFASAELVPQSAKLAIMALTCHWYEQREPATTNEGATRRVPLHVKALLAQLRGGRLEMAT
ncbi:MAG TPA: head-tail connector protein [Caulobacterales bacterium]|nr:head-tail connector protein [Caulobacterales bacterium]